MRTTTILDWGMAFALAALVTTASAADGLQSREESAHPWAGLKTRLSISTVTSLRSDFSTALNEGAKVNSLSVMRDYYLNVPWLGASSGLRATSGMLFGAHANTPWSSPSAIERRHVLGSGGHLPGPDQGTLPYLGVGYTSLSDKSGWGVSADFGLMARNPRSAVQLGRTFTGGQSLDDTLRELRLSPLLQIGVSYSF